MQAKFIRNLLDCCHGFIKGEVGSGRQIHKIQRWFSSTLVLSCLSTGQDSWWSQTVRVGWGGGGGSRILIDDEYSRSGRTRVV